MQCRSPETSTLALYAHSVQNLSFSDNYFLWVLQWKSIVTCILYVTITWPGQPIPKNKVREVWSGWFIRLCRCLMGGRAGADIKGILRGPRGPKNAFDSLSVLTTLASNCYTFCGCNFCRLVTPWQSVERHPMTPTLAAPTEDNGGIH